MQSAAFSRCRALPPAAGGNTQISISFGERTDSGILRQAWQAVAGRHGILRTTFAPYAGEMLSCKEVDGGHEDWTTLDWQADAPESVPQKWNELLTADAAKPFDPGTLPLVRFHEIRLPGGTAHFLLSFPGFLLDEFSVVRVLADWLLAIGQPLSSDGPEVEKPAPGSLAAWKEILGAAEGPLQLHPRPDGWEAFVQCASSLGREETAAFADFCAARKLDRQVVLQSLWALVQRRFGATGNITLGLHSARQSTEAGYFECWLPVVHEWAGTVGDWLLAAQKRHLAATANAWISPEQALAATGQTLRLEDIPSTFAWRGEPLNDILHSALPRWINFDARIQPRPPAGLALEARDGTRLQLAVSAGSESAARDLLARITLLIADLPQLFDKPLAKVPVLQPEEISTLRAWARGPESIEHPETLTAAFRATAAARPDEVAVQTGADALTFAALDAHSDKLASHLAKAGLAGGWHVGLFLSPSSWVATALLGAWKAGNLCVPVDPSAPPEWVESTFSSNDVGVVLCDSSSASLLDESSRRRIVIDQDWDTLETSDLPQQDIRPDTPAAILAGHSDGEPQIVRALTHSQLVAAALEGARVLNFGPGDSFLAHSAAGGGGFFDEWLLPVLAGGTVLTAGNDLLDPAMAPVTHLRLTAPEWHNQAARWTHGGEPIAPGLRVVAVEAGSPRATALDIWNQHAGGQLSTIVFFSPAGLCGLGIAANAQADAALLPMGKPTPDVEASVFDPDFHEMPPGYSGELAFRFPGWKKLAGGSGRKGMVTGLRAWRNKAGNICIESSEKRAPGIPTAAERRALGSLAESALDAHIGAHAWVLGSTAPAGVLSVTEWPLTRGGWIDDSLLPVPEVPVPKPAKPCPPPARPTAPAQPWNPVTVLQENGTLPTLVLIPSASGTPDIYRDLASALGDSRRVIGIVARGFHSPDSCHPSVESAAAAYIAALLEEDPSASFVLAGFGFGGTVALEMARQLAAAGRPAPELLLIGTTAPAAEQAGGWLSTIKSAFKRLSSPGPMEPHPARSEPALSHEAAWRKYQFEPASLTAQIVIPSDFPPDAGANWLSVLPDARIEPVKCRWDEMLTFPAVKRLASILNNGD